MVAGFRGIDKDAGEMLVQLSGENQIEYEVITGGANGVDKATQEWVEASSLFVYNDDFHLGDVDWRIHGRSAGPKRNQAMAEYADMLVAIWDGESTGTRDMIDRALNEGLDIHVKIVD